MLAFVLGQERDRVRPLRVRRCARVDGKQRPRPDRELDHGRQGRGQDSQRGAHGTYARVLRCMILAYVVRVCELVVVRLHLKSAKGQFLVYYGRLLCKNIQYYSSNF